MVGREGTVSGEREIRVNKAEQQRLGRESMGTEKARHQTRKTVSNSGTNSAAVWVLARGRGR